MNRNKKWYSLFLVMLISLATVIQPIQAVATVATLDTVAEETQTKSMETPIVDHIEETSSVVEDATATSASEETKTADTTEVIEETISSEITEETTASEEKTVESSTEETKESIEKPKAKALRAEREPRNIQELLKEGEKFIETASIKVNGVDYPLDGSGEAIPHDANIDVYYHYNIPNRLLSEGDAPLMSGDFYEIDLPKGLQLKNGNGDLTSPEPENSVFGQYQYQNGKLKFTFNKKVEELSNIHGKTVYSHKLDTSNEVGEGFISIPYNDEETIEVPIFIKPTKGDEITKSGKASNDQKRITWEVSINTKLDELNNATVKDDLPNHIKFESVSIYPQRVNLQGKVVSVSEIPLVEGTDYILDKNTNNVTFIGRYAKTKESFKLVYETSVEDSIIPEDGGTIPVVNKATLINGDNKKEDSGKVNLKYGKLLDKSNPNRVKDSSTEGYVYSWQVYLNYGYKNLTPEQSKVTDKLTSNLKYIEDSVEVKSKTEPPLVNGEDYIIKFNSDKNEMTIEYPKGLSTAVDISYKTEVVGTVDDDFKETSIKNQVSVGGKDPIVKGGTIAKNGIVKSGTIDYEKRIIKWEINFNTNHYELFNWSMVDTIPAGLTFIEGTLAIKSDRAKTPLPSSDYTHNLTEENKLNVAFIGDLAKKGSKDSYKLTYETSFDRKVGTFVNEADTKWTNSTGETEYKQEVKGNVTVHPFYVTDVSKYGEYDPNQKQLQWNVIVNYSQDELKNATISDPITGNQELLKESVKVYELKVNSNGSTSRVKEVTKDVSIEISDNKVFIKLPDGSKSAYELELKTSLANKDIAAKYQNTATFENNGHKEEGPFTVNIPDGGILIRKNGGVDWDGNSNYLKWSVDINPTQSTINNLVITDKPSNNQIIDKKSIKLFGTTLGAEKKYNKDRTKVLEEGKDYKVNLDTNNETGQQILTVEFLSKVTKMYVLEYKSLMTPMKIGVNETFLNNISMTGNGQIPIETGDSKDVTVWTSSGTANGDTASFTLVKESKMSKEKLAGAEFELWTSVDKSGKLIKGQLVRSGITDDNGELKIGRLIPNTTYLLFETKSPKGYSVSEDLQKGYPLKLESDGMTNLFKPQTFINDIPRIQLKKIDADTKKAIANAEFVIKNADGKFYNGIDDKNKSQWEASENEAKKLVSNEKGIVEVVGLEPGVYSAKETNAPEGYDKLTQDVAFEVVDDLGWIRLKKPVTIENKAYETTLISINKTWNDANNQDGKRPDNISFDLLADKEVIKTLTLSKDDKETVKTTVDGKDIWSKTFDGLRKFDKNMKEITYSVKEHEVSGYVIPEEALEVKDRKVNVTNTYTPEKVSLIAKKIWDDKNNQDGKRPSYIVVHVMAKVEGEEKATSVEHVRVDEASDWKYEFKDLPKFKDGKEITYTVEEETVDGYDVNVTNMKPEDKPKEFDYGFDITNTHKPKETKVSGTKTWEDNNNQDGIRPEVITVSLLADGQPVLDKDKNTVIKEVAADTEGKWSYTFENLPKFKAGTEIVYSVKEAEVKGYTSKVDGMNLTNTHKPSIIQVMGEKVWDDNFNQDGIRPTKVKINLLADGQIVDSQELTGDKNAPVWRYMFANLPEFKDGKKIEYTVTEDSVLGYTGTIKGTEITNSYTPGKRDVTVQKIWNDADNQDGIRPEVIKVQLYADDKELGEAVELTEEKAWNHTWSELPVKQAGKAVKYEVKEVEAKELEAYTTKTEEESEGNFVITNSYKPKETEISVNKVWEDADNQDGIRPDSIKVQLLADDKELGEAVELTEEKAWNHTWTELPVKQTGETIKYSVKEVQAKNLEVYTSTVEEKEAGKFTITNSYKPQETRLFVEKVWDDANNQDGKRPKSIDVQLLTNGVKGKIYTLSKENNWKISFDKLAVFAKGKKIDYTVEEISAAAKKAGYTAKIAYSSNKENKQNTDATVTNSREIEKVSVSGTKTFQDADNQDGIRPTSITVKLLADGKEIKEQKVNAETKWTYSFTDLPKNKVDEEGQEIKYTVEEESTGYKPEITKTETGFDIVNVHTPELTKVTGTKTWNDADNQDGIRPDMIKVNLLADGEKIQSKEVTAESNWSYEFIKLPVYKVGEVGKEVVYSIEEEAVEGYTFEASKDNFDITNTHIPEKTELNGVKIWKDNNDQDGIRPDDITVNLLADGQPVLDEEGKAVTATVNEASDWKYNFKDLPKFKAGQEIEYTVTEDVVENYTVDIKGTEITNSYTPGKRDISVQKIWDDADNQDGLRPDDIKVQLYADGKELGKAVKLTEEKAWSHTWTELPVKQAGKAVKYEVKELEAKELEAYTTKTEEKSEGNFVITNSYKPKETKVLGTKTWKDANNQDGIRPTEITVNLFADGKKVDEVKVTEKSDWKYEFKDLPVNKSGKEIKYSVTENKVDGYETTIDGFNITNTHTPKEVLQSGGKSTNNKSGYLPKTGEAETTALVNLGVTMIIIFLMSHIWVSQRRQSKED